MNQRLAILAMGATLLFVGCLLPLERFPASASTGAVRSHTCSFARLTVTVASADAAGGIEGMLIAFRNKSAATCVLLGYPKVVATRPGMSSVATASPSTYIGGLQPGALPPLVRLKSGKRASVVVAAGDEPRPVSSPCVHQRYKTVTVSLPSQSGSKRLSAELPKEGTTLPSCSGVVVTPFQTGLTWFSD
jgi:hypothetical protein